MRDSDLDVRAIRSFAAQCEVDVAEAVKILNETGASAADCASAKGRDLFAAMEAMARAGEQPDVATLAERCVVAGRDFVTDTLLSSVIEVGTAAQRLKLLRETSLRRQYLEALRAVAVMLKDGSQPLAHATSEAHKLLATWHTEDAGVRTLDGSVLALLDTLEAVQQGKREPTLKTGIEALDAVIGGLQPTLTVIGALPGIGKSSLIVGIARLLAARGVKTGVLSLEDEREWVTRRLLSHASGVPLFTLANEPLTRAQMLAIEGCIEGVHRLASNIICDDRHGASAAEVVESARRMISMGAKAIFVDHLGEIRLDRTDRHDLEISDALRELRGIAKVTRVPVIVATHMRRRDSLDLYKEPMLSDFAFSAGVERMARVALGLWREEGTNERINVTVLKQTQGVSGVSISLNVAAQSGVVTETAASAAAKELYA